MTYEEDLRRQREWRDAQRRREEAERRAQEEEAKRRAKAEAENNKIGFAACFGPQGILKSKG
jgi:hypothetical protein